LPSYLLRFLQRLDPLIDLYSLLSVLLKSCPLARECRYRALILSHFIHRHAFIQPLCGSNRRSLSAVEVENIPLKHLSYRVSAAGVLADPLLEGNLWCGACKLLWSSNAVKPVSIHEKRHELYVCIVEGRFGP
jgi:hypothetical protein